jgi:hypothetical protein
VTVGVTASLYAVSLAGSPRQHDSDALRPSGLASAAIEALQGANGALDADLAPGPI